MPQLSGTWIDAAYILMRLEIITIIQFGFETTQARFGTITLPAVRPIDVDLIHGSFLLVDLKIDAFVVVRDPTGILVGLTAKGKTAYYAHRHWHQTMDGGFREYFHNLDQDRIDFVIEFLTKFETFLKRALQQ